MKNISYQSRGASREVEQFLSLRIDTNEQAEKVATEAQLVAQKSIQFADEELWRSYEFAVQNNLLTQEESLTILGRLRNAEVKLSNMRRTLAEKIRNDAELLGSIALQRETNNSASVAPASTPIATTEPAAASRKRGADHSIRSSRKSQFFGSARRRQKVRPTIDSPPRYRAVKPERVQSEVPAKQGKAALPQRPLEESTQTTVPGQTETPEPAEQAVVLPSTPLLGLKDALQTVRKDAVGIVNAAGKTSIGIDKKLIFAIVQETTLAAELRNATEAVPNKLVSQEVFDAWTSELREYYRLVDRTVGGTLFNVIRNASGADFVQMLSAIRSLTSVLYDTTKNLRIQRSISDEKILAMYDLPQAEAETIRRLMASAKAATADFVRMLESDLLASPQALPGLTPEEREPAQAASAAASSESRIARLQKALTGNLSLGGLLTLLIGSLALLGDVSGSFYVRPLVFTLKYLVSVAISRTVDTKSLAGLNRFLAGLNLITNFSAFLSGTPPEIIREKVLEKISDLGGSKILNLVIGYIPSFVQTLIVKTLRFLQLKEFKKNAVNKLIDGTLEAFEIGA